MPKPLNVLLITTDQMRRDHMGCADNPVIRTPNLDRLAAGGVNFDRAYVNNPLCMPNRSTLATGRLPRNHNCWSNGINLPACERTIGDALAEAGYHTALLGKAHFNTFGRGRDVPLDAAGQECGEAWEKSVYSADWTGPYYGFEHVELAIGHGVDNIRRAHLGQWVRGHHPGAIVGLQRREDSPIGSRQCFTADVPAEAYSSSWLGTIGPDTLRRLAAGDRPFFLWVSFPDPHHPFCPPRPFDTMYDPREVPPPRLGPEALADKPAHFRTAYHGREGWEGIGPDARLDEITSPQLAEIIARTYGMVSLIDENVGKLLDALDAAHLADSTVVVFTSDHGDLMGDAGLVFKGPFLLEGLINVPMIWRVPGGSRGARSRALMNTADVAPTLLELLGVPVPRAMDGLAMADLARTGAAGRRDAAIVEFKSMYRTELNLRTVVTADRKLTYYAGHEFGELYDMTADVPEARNLYDDPAWARQRQALIERLLADALAGEDERTWPTSGA